LTGGRLNQDEKRPMKTDLAYQAMILLRQKKGRRDLPGGRLFG